MPGDRVGDHAAPRAHPSGHLTANLGGDRLAIEKARTVVFPAQRVQIDDERRADGDIGTLPRDRPVVDDLAENPSGEGIGAARPEGRIVVHGGAGTTTLTLQSAGVGGQGSIEGVDGDPVVGDTKESHALITFAGNDLPRGPRLAMPFRGRPGVNSHDGLTDLAAELPWGQSTGLGKHDSFDHGQLLWVGDHSGLIDQN